MQEVQIVEFKVWSFFKCLLSLVALISFLALVICFAYTNRKPYYVKNSSNLSMEQFLLQKHSMIIETRGDPAKEEKLKGVFRNVVYIHDTLFFDRNSFSTLLPNDGIAFVSDHLTLVFTDDLDRVGNQLRTEIEAD
jgi:hypothetical protein